MAADYRLRARKQFKVEYVYGRGHLALVSDAQRPRCVVLFEDNEAILRNYHYQLKEGHATKAHIVDLHTGRTIVDSEKEHQHE